MAEKRHAKRWQLFYYLRVFDTESGDLMGHVVDITTRGMMLIGEKAIPKGQLFRLRLELPDSEGLPSDLELRAQSRWSTCEVNKSFYDTGFTLVNPSQLTIGAIQRIIDELHFPSPTETAEDDSRYALSQTGTV